MEDGNKYVPPTMKATAEQIAARKVFDLRRWWVFNCYIIVIVVKIDVFCKYTIDRNQDTIDKVPCIGKMDSFIFVGTSFRGFMKNDYFIGTWISWIGLVQKRL